MQTDSAMEPGTPEDCFSIEDFTSACWNNDRVKLAAFLTRPDVSSFVNKVNQRGTIRVAQSLTKPGQAALYCAARQGHLDIIYDLLSVAGTDVNIPAKGHGGTPLHGTWAFLVFC